jgi:hypothetical protein
MQRGTASALTVIRVARGAPAPAGDALKAAIDTDRARQHLGAQTYFADYAVAGPYAVTVNGQELDEYVVWER